MPQDVDEIVIHYPSMFELMDDLRGMGESNAVLSRPLRLNRDVLFAAASIYDGKARCAKASVQTKTFRTIRNPTRRR